MYLPKSQLLILFDARDDFLLSGERHVNTPYLSYTMSIEFYVRCV